MFAKFYSPGDVPAVGITPGLERYIGGIEPPTSHQNSHTGTPGIEPGTVYCPTRGVAAVAGDQSVLGFAYLLPTHAAGVAETGIEPVKSLTFEVSRFA